MNKWIACLLLFITLPLYAGVRGDLRKGGKLYRQKKYGQALSKYHEILQRDPHQEEASLGAGAAAYYLKDYAAAQTAFEQAAQQQGPRQTDALFNLGNSYYRAQQPQQALKAYRQAILKNPNDKEAIHNLQLILESQQNQANQNQQNNQNQNNNSSNQQNQKDQKNQGDKPDKSENSSSQNPADKEAADRVMQMAQDQEFKPYPQTGKGAADSSVEKDW